MHEPMLRAISLIDPDVQTNSHIETPIRYTTPLHYHDFFEIFIITEGKCIHRVNQQEQYLDKGSMVFIRPGDTHSYRYCNNNTDCCFINLNRVFRQNLNTTPTAYINQLRLRYARELLLKTNLSILEVSLEAGYENLSHFYHLFREAFGISPGNLRRS